jgi:hypothetical protein
MGIPAPIGGLEAQTPRSFFRRRNGRECNYLSTSILYSLETLIRLQKQLYSNDMSSLDGLRDVSISIIKTVISHPIGFAKLPSSTETVFSPKEQQLLDLNRELDNLSREIVEARESTGLTEKRIPPLLPVIVDL